MSLVASSAVFGAPITYRWCVNHHQQAEPSIYIFALSLCPFPHQASEQMKGEVAAIRAALERMYEPFRRDCEEVQSEWVKITQQVHSEN